ncbi:hypothetical protein HZS_7365 [Henneguya salminicola]|nr:hypothetical protein HZS_7365 [Henneguya salminicola]
MHISLKIIPFSIFYTAISLMEDSYCKEKSCYEVLNVNRNATKNEIKKSFRKLAGIYHPDVNKNVKTVHLFPILSRAHDVIICI